VLQGLIDGHIASFDRPGVLSVRPGYEFTRSWLTGRRAIVVTVSRKLRSLPAEALLPEQVAGVPVDVRQASARKRMELQQPDRYASQLRLAPDTGSVPHFPQERTLAGDHPAATASAHARLAAIAKTPLAYTAPPGVTLKPITAQVSLLLSASPDTGWPVLRDFLTATTDTLTVGMYDFTAAHIATAVKAALVGKQLKLVLDHPPQNATADQTDADTVADLRRALAASFGQAWALTKLDKDATAWIYPTSYHIKVAVRDRVTVSLSSGNWNNSNQPHITPATNTADAATAQHRDRDWHVVVTGAKLAGVFEDYLLNDLTVAEAHDTSPEAPGAPLMPPTLPSAKTPTFGQFFPSATVSGRIKIAPLLTPDPGVYAGAVKTLIASATQTLYMQFQYIELPKTTDATSQAFVDLVQAVIDRHTAGVDVRIIMSEYETAGYLEQLQAAGLDVVTTVKIQNNVHNKGIIVDGKTVLVSSQNWSTDGTLYNRDAGLIIYNKTAAHYYQQIFLHDWQHLAKPKALPD
jgi:hypothetical protein